MKRCLVPLFALVLSLGLALPAGAASVDVCYNYGCYVQAPVLFSEPELLALGRRLAQAGDGAEERQALAEVLGRMYRIAGSQTPIWRDRGGNLEDDGVDGRMDCIDHSTTASRFIALLAERGWLRFHTPEPRQMRRRGLIFEHWTAVIADEGGQRYAVDRWFFDHGEPPAVIPFADWLAGKDPEAHPRVAEVLREEKERQVNQ